jgi:hypothetical protein
MPMIDPIQAAWLRRHWPFTGATIVFVVFMLGHVVVFNPAAQRYRAAIKQAAELGISIERGQQEPLMPPRVLAFISDNAMTTAEATSRGESGELTSALLEEVTRLTRAHGMEVIATEPDAVVQLSHAVQVRARLRVECSYPQFVAFLDTLSHSGKLIAVDRFTLSSEFGERRVLDLSISRHIIKRDEKA